MEIVEKYQIKQNFSVKKGLNKTNLQVVKSHLGEKI
jgi:hypothetical protein